MKRYLPILALIALSACTKQEPQTPVASDPIPAPEAAAPAIPTTSQAEYFAKHLEVARTFAAKCRAKGAENMDEKEKATCEHATLAWEFQPYKARKN